MADIRNEGDARSRVESRLLPGERIVWVGKPDPSVNFTAADGWLIPYSIVWTALTTTFFVVFVSQYGISYLGFAFFPLFGLYLLFGRFLYKRWNKRRTVYAITTQRALILVGSRAISSVSAHGQQITPKMSRNGEHVTVLFESERRWWTSRNFAPNMGMDWWPRLVRWPFAFYDVADVAGLQDALAQSRIPADEGVHHV